VSARVPGAQWDGYGVGLATRKVAGSNIDRYALVNGVYKFNLTNFQDALKIPEDFLRDKS